HRHHAVDAIVIAMTDRSTLQNISRLNASLDFEQNPNKSNLNSKNINYFVDKGKIKIPKPWEKEGRDFRKEVKEKIDEIIVYHKPDHGKRGKLHEDTYYGILNNPIKIKNKKGNVAEMNVVSRKDISSLSEDQIM